MIDNSATRTNECPIFTFFRRYLNTKLSGDDALLRNGDFRRYWSAPS
jgi:hypothetical protein